MSRIKSFFAALILACSGITLTAPIALAEATTVVVIDRAKIMRESKAGKDVIAKVTAIETQMNTELKPKGDAFTQARANFIGKFNGMTREQAAAAVQSSAELQAEDKKVAELNRQAVLAQRVASAELELTERKAWSDFYAALRPVLKSVVDERGAQLMIDRSEVVYVGPTIDVTDLAISKLDAATPTITVVRQKLPDQAVVQ